ncbi:MAG: ABC transporter permease [Planctomycetes bacterium]|nr:ABC transporter permease [Planctomycetota bacterium]
MKPLRQPEHYPIPWFQLALTLLGSCVLLLVVAPLLGLVFTSSFSELRGAALDKEVMGSIRITLFAALAATTTCAVAGIPLAYLLARKNFIGKTVVLAIIDLPIIIPHSAAGIALLTVIGRRSLLGSALGDSLRDTTAGISVAMAFVSMPFLLNAAREGFAAVPEKYEQVARTLGATPLRTFFTVSLPLARRAILSGMILMWARGISEFGAVIIIAYHPTTTPVLILRRFEDYGLPQARSIAVLLIFLCLILIATMRLVAGGKRKGRKQTG